MFFYRFIRGAVSIYLKLFYKWQVYGSENIPNQGSVILIANHISNFDPPVVGCSVERPVHFMAKEELFNNPILSKVVTGLGAFPIKRGGNDRKAIKTGLQILKEQRILGIFPEGTRSKTGEVGKGLPGAAMFALKTDATVIPVGIVSSYQLFKPIIINIGKPLTLEKYKKEKSSSEDLVQAIEYMMEGVKKQVNEAKKL